MGMHNKNDMEKVTALENAESKCKVSQEYV